MKQVEAFRRKVVFFRHDVDLACLQVPEPGRHARDFLWRVRAFDVAGANCISNCVDMTNDGILVLPCPNMILCVNGSGKAQKLVSLSELTVAGVDKRPKGLHIEQLLGASATANVVYVSLSNEPEHAPGVVYTASGSWYLGRLDLTNRQLVLMPCDYPRRSFERPALDLDEGLVYRREGQSLVRKTFNSKILSHWPLPNFLYDLCLCPDKRTMLLATGVPSAAFSILDLRTGHRTDLPIAGRAMAWGANQTLYYLVERDCGQGVLDTSLFRFRIGDKEPKRLFLVSCQRVARQDSFLATHRGSRRISPGLPGSCR